VAEPPALAQWPSPCDVARGGRRPQQTAQTEISDSSEETGRSGPGRAAAHL